MRESDAGKRTAGKSAVGLLLAFLFAGCLWMWEGETACAYFERGTVKVSVGKTSLRLKKGESESITLSFSPSESSQLPGCGMEECPRICGEKNCLDENGECTCNGTEYTTYHTSAEVSSDQSGVATVSYSGNVMTVRAVGAGEATITVKASLRQYTSGLASVKVTVEEAATTSTEAATAAESTASAVNKISAADSTQAKKKNKKKKKAKKAKKVSKATEETTETAAETTTETAAEATTEAAAEATTATAAEATTEAAVEATTAAAASDTAATETVPASSGTSETEEDVGEAGTEDGEETGPGRNLLIASGTAAALVIIGGILAFGRRRRKKDD